MNMFLGEPELAVYVAMAFAALALGDHFLARIDARVRTWGQLIPAAAWLAWAWFEHTLVQGANASASQAGPAPPRFDAAITFPVLVLLTMAFLGIWISGLVRCFHIWRGTGTDSSSN